MKPEGLWPQIGLGLNSDGPLSSYGFLDGTHALSEPLSPNPQYLMRKYNELLQVKYLAQPLALSRASKILTLFLSLVKYCAFYRKLQHVNYSAR